MMNGKGTSGALRALAVGGLVLGLGVQSIQAQQGAETTAGKANTMLLRGELSRAGEDFLIKAALIDLTEVQAGKLAQKKGTIPAVRNFGEHMVNDHGKIQIGLKEIAAQKGAAVPTELSQTQDSMHQHLEGLPGKSFDRAYAQDMVKGHTQAVKKFTWAAKNIDDPDLRAWAQTTLPLLQEHLRMAENMEAAVKRRVETGLHSALRSPPGRGNVTPSCRF